MRESVKRQLKASAYDFANVVWPAISHSCGGGRIEPVEGVTETDFTKTLDILGGIDAWQVIDGVGVRGIASRVQWGIDYGTFTVRKSLQNGGETEWHRIQRVSGMLKRGFVRAHLIVQAYLYGKPGCGGNLAAAYIVRAPDLYRFCDDSYEGLIWSTRRVVGGNTMAVFSVDAMRQHGCNVKEIRVTAEAA